MVFFLSPISDSETIFHKTRGTLIIPYEKRDSRKTFLTFRM